MKDNPVRNPTKKQTQQYKVGNIEELNPSVVILKYLQPPREILKSNNQLYWAFKQLFCHLPSFCQCYHNQLHPLAPYLEPVDYHFDLDMLKNIYKRDLELKISPFKTKSYSKFIDIRKTNYLSQLVENEKEDILFDSNFQSGNLLSADRDISKSYCYHLMMQNDINTYGCTQWFFFKTTNKCCAKVTFYINNFYKYQSLYQKGMKVLILSKKKFEKEGVGWTRGGEQIGYFKNKITELKQGGGIKQFYSLKFVYHFLHDNDEVYFAYSYPYTYSKLNNFLLQKEIILADSAIYNCRSLCRTAAENKIFLVTITNSYIPKQKKSSIFITSRVHPGETVSSLMMHGMIQFLISNDAIAVALRSRFVFKLFPMVNPDGVVHGNYRANLAGVDLNRVWDSVDPVFCPQINEIKKYITEFNKQCPISMFCDLHGHSSRKGAFIYGCQNQRIKSEQNEEQSKLFPLMFSAINGDFRYKSCNFAIQKYKKGTARVQLWRQLKIPNIFTLEVSFASAEHSQHHFRPSDYEQIGVSFCKNIHEYFFNHEKRNHFSEQLRKNNQYHLYKKNDQDDSQSDNDLLDKKGLNQLKTGQSCEVWKRRKLILPKPITKPGDDFKETRKEFLMLPKKKFPFDRVKKMTKTGSTGEISCSIVSVTNKKLFMNAVQTKKLAVATADDLKFKEMKGYYLINSGFQRVDHNYRGRSGMYRAQQRKNFKSLTTESYLRRPLLLHREPSLNFY